ncbi:synapse-associated protein 1-like [Betta splendens]|uniref:Synapse-associated protein 1 n=1 Tax=Betta splendens TaxID=158456 RepID=A0A6P7M515_BETSP|nr:synapse-associated protein 1-like [Betta splendens]
MFTKWGVRLGIEHEQVEQQQVAVEHKSQGGNNETTVAGRAETSSATKKDAESTPLSKKAKGLSGYVYNFACSATKKLSESFVETAQTLKKSVEEGEIHEIIDKTILGDFQKEQERFIQEKKARKSTDAVPPWVGYNDEDTVQQQILFLSADKRNFLRDPPAGVQFNFDFEQMYPVAMVMLEEDELLRKMRFHLVPKQVKEEVFWKNYFYRVSLIKQSAQLTALAAQQAAERNDVDKSHEHPHQKDVSEQRIPPSTRNSKPKPSEDEISTSPPVSEFVSDTFDSCKINEDDLRREMEQLVLDKQEHPSTQQEETADWERELQEELQGYDTLPNSENHDENWDREIEEMLKEDS